MTPTPGPTETIAEEGEGQPDDLPQFIAGRVTPYDDGLAGNPLGCGGTYDVSDPTIIAVSPALGAEWPCGTPIGIWGPAGQIVGLRQDTCPGCAANHLDLSRAAFEAVCGPAASTCEVVFRSLP